MKRIKALAVILITVLLSGVLGGCGINLKDILVQPDKEYGDFLYNTFEKSEYLEAYATISGLTEQGQQKEVLVVPESINGLPVRGLRKRSALWGGQSVEWHSDNLKVLYLYNNIISETRFYCKNHKKTILINIDDDDYVKDFGNYIYIFFASYFKRNYVNHIRVYPANITYYYNYENSPNSGCYWLDDLENGEKITYIPQEPKREGYKFCGWYKEEDCLNRWDFENDAVIAKEYDWRDQSTFYENKLYAKWVKE